MTRIAASIYLLLAAIFAAAPLLFEAGEQASSPWTPFIASFHPLILHLPIGMIAALLALELGSFIGRKTDLSTRNFIWLLTALSATASFSTGYLLGEEGGYDRELLSDHLWAAGIFTSICWSTLAINELKKHTLLRLLSLIAISISLVVASHPGGVIVHGDPFAAAPWKDKPSPSDNYGLLAEPGDPFNPYLEIIQPIMDAKCVSCHGEEKKKGKLRLDSFEAAMRGGDFGECIEPGDSFNSLLVELLEYPLDDEDHMPPEDEPQLTQAEIDVIKWWIDSGARPDQMLPRAEAPDVLHPFFVPNYRLLEKPPADEMVEMPQPSGA
ncbi:c-type cytochrome domain-containing protein [Pelagicoccus sp. SDUM812002]|uniref:c-type cytochrome domain-containing protein n=1 Tax=Pelagicoccus sp. SDUM812002 TaxID=3041266 RepID=UPI00280EA48A|nr:c-type cytochrome domain-containing protein [Pelagicoccus sp. SDUM812002]MDQ8188303.1 hypothetical protein [Pelagicoccus sp. SDUM812002]